MFRKVVKDDLTHTYLMDIPCGPCFSSGLRYSDTVLGKLSNSNLGQGIPNKISRVVVGSIGGTRQKEAPKLALIAKPVSDRCNNLKVSTEGNGVETFFSEVNSRKE